MLFAACQGVSSSGGPLTVSGKIVSLNTTGHSVTVQGNLNGQQQMLTIGGLTDQQIAALNGHIGATYNFQVSQNNNDYAITTNTDPVSESETTPGTTNVQNTTPEATTPPNTTVVGNVQGTISLMGKIQNSSNTSVTVLMPNGQTLTASITVNTDRGDANIALNPNTLAKIKVFTNPDGSFQAKSLKIEDNAQKVNDLNTISFEGITTSAVGPDNILHFQVGNKTYSATCNNFTELKNMNNAQNIASHQPIKVDVLYNGSNGSVAKVEISNNN